MRVVVEVESGPRVGGRWLLRPGDQMTFGRTERADIIIAEDPILSSCHFRVAVDRDSCVIEDMDSTNGTWIADQRVSRAQVKDGDRIKAGNSIFVFQVDARDAYKRTTDDAQARIRSQASYTELPASRPRKPVEPDATHERHPPIERPIPIEPPERFKQPESIKGIFDPQPSERPPVERAPHPTSPKNTTPSSPSLAPSTSTVGPQKPASSIERPPRSPKRTEPVQSMPRDLTVVLSQCGSGLWRGVQKLPAADSLLMIELLTRSIRPMFVIDFARTGLPQDDLPDNQSVGYLMANLPPEVAAIVSPRMLRLEDLEQRAAWINEGWGSDGMTVILTHVELSPMLEHFQRLMKSGASSGDSNRGVLGLCWPSVLEAVLNDGKPKLVNELMEPCEAILLESTESPGGWALYGDHRLPELLASCQIPQSVAEEASSLPSEKPPENSPD